MKPKTLILKTAGINCDVELAHGFEIAGSDAEIVHINELVREEKSLLDYDILGFPGGFSYGDDLSAGRVLATEIIGNVMSDLFEFYKSGGLIIGICNGFQTLVKAGILPWLLDTPHEDESMPEATLFWNDSGKFEDRWTALRVEPGTKCVWTKDYPGMIELPVAHAEGKFIPANDGVLDRLISGGQIVFRYCDVTNPDGCESGEVPYPANPNGSIANIAGICDPTGRVLGMMPHPERFLYPENHPRWTRMPDEVRVDGYPLFRNAVEYVRSEKGVAAKG